MSSRSYVTQKDQRLQVEGAQIVAAPESALALPGSVAIGPGGKYTQKITSTSEYSPEVAATVKDILQFSQDANAQALGLSQQALLGVFGVSEQLSQQAESGRLGETSAYLKYFPYIIIALIALYFLKK